MRTVELSPSGLKPTVLCLGTSLYGTHIPENQSFQLLDRYIELGGNIIDSAHVYACWLPDGVGASEKTVGKWLKSNPGSNLLVSTKGGHPHLETMNTSRLQFQDVKQDLEESMERLGVDQIDLYWLHRDDEQIPVCEIIDYLDEFHRKGLIKAVAVSNWTTERISEANQYAQTVGKIKFCSSQIGWSLARILEQEEGAVPGMIYMNQSMKKHYSDLNIPVFAFSSQARGFFADKYDWSKAPSKDSVPPPLQCYYSKENFQLAEKATGLAVTHQVTANQIALAWLLNQTIPVSAIIGPGTVEQLENSIQALEISLTDDEIAYLN